MRRQDVYRAAIEEIEEALNEVLDEIDATTDQEEGSQEDRKHPQEGSPTEDTSDAS